MKLSIYYTFDKKIFEVLNCTDYIISIAFMLLYCTSDKSLLVGILLANFTLPMKAFKGL